MRYSYAVLIMCTALSDRNGGGVQVCGANHAHRPY
jgi:hypothetical protein